MKYSKFNLIVPHGHELILFNTLSGETYELNEKLCKIINHNDTNLLDEETTQQFNKSKIIIEDNYDEDRVIKYHFDKTKYANGVLTATVLLTWKCNFRCIYCYEGGGEKYTHTMTIETADSVIRFLINIANWNNISNIHIVLFGGEPLLNIEMGFHILEMLKKYCDETEKKLSCSMVSNGSLLTRYIIEKLIAYRCSFIQITLDGSENTHNNRRLAKNGQPSFKPILENIRLLDEFYEKIGCVIRMNVDKVNMEEVETLMKILREQGIQHASLDFGIVHSVTDSCLGYSGNCFKEEELGEVLDRLWKTAAQQGFTRYPNLQRKSCYCGLYCENNYTISPKGEVYKCWEMVGDERHKIGDISSKGTVENIQYALYDWMTIDPFDNEECAKCPYLPLCGGGCIMFSMNSTGSYHGNGCFKVKGVIEKQVIEFVKRMEQHERRDI